MAPEAPRSRSHAFPARDWAPEVPSGCVGGCCVGATLPLLQKLLWELCNSVDPVMGCQMSRQGPGPYLRVALLTSHFASLPLFLGFELTCVRAYGKLDILDLSLLGTKVVVFVFFVFV